MFASCPCTVSSAGLGPRPQAFPELDVETAAVIWGPQTLNLARTSHLLLIKLRTMAERREWFLT